MWIKLTGKLGKVRINTYTILGYEAAIRNPDVDNIAWSDCNTVVHMCDDYSVEVSETADEIDLLLGTSFSERRYMGAK